MDDSFALLTGCAFVLLIVIIILVYFLQCMGRIAFALETLARSNIEINKTIGGLEKKNTLKITCPRCNQELDITACASGSTISCPTCKCGIEI